MSFCGFYTTSKCNLRYKYIAQPICPYLHFTPIRGFLFIASRTLLLISHDKFKVFVSNFISSKLCFWDGAQHSPNLWSKTQTTMKMKTRVFGMPLVIMNASLPCYTIIYSTKFMAFYNDPGPYPLDGKTSDTNGTEFRSHMSVFFRLYCSDSWQTPGQYCCQISERPDSAKYVTCDF